MTKSIILLSSIFSNLFIQYVIATQPSLSSVSLTSTPPSTIIGYDLTYVYTTMNTVNGYEEIQLVSSIQGLVNRNQPRLMVWLESSDTLWWNFLTGPQGYFEGTMVTNMTNITALVNYFTSPQYGTSFIQGIVLYDPTVYCTSSIADTIAGAENLLPVAYRPNDPTSLYTTLVVKLNIPIIKSVVNQFNGNITGSIKRDAYTWAVDNYIKTNKVDASNLAYYIDYYWTSRNDTQGWEKATISNRDYFYAHQSFFFDLSIWADEAPIDEPNQPLGSDLAAFQYMLLAAYNQVQNLSLIRIGGFTPWFMKYVQPWGKHQGVETEWETLLFTSAYNTYVDGDACCIGNMASASLYQYIPLANRYIQPTTIPSKATLQAKGYLDAQGNVIGNRLYYMWYAGDFDSAAWLYSQLLSRWNDPMRGNVSIGWPIDPGLSERFPVIYPTIFSTMAENDVYISGDSGLGYINPTLLYGPTRTNISGFPDGRNVWINANTGYYRQFDISFSGFIITGDGPNMDINGEMMYYNFSANGLVNQGFGGEVTHLSGNMPVTVQSDIPSDVNDAVNALKGSYNPNDPIPHFHMFRSVLTSPTYLSQVTAAASNASNGNIIVVDPLTLGTLIRIANGGNINNRVKYIDDTIPASGTSNSNVTFTIAVSNDGWNTLSANNHSLLIQIINTQELVYTGFMGDAFNSTMDSIRDSRSRTIPLQNAYSPRTSLRQRLTYQGYRGKNIYPNDITQKQFSDPLWSISIPFPSDLNTESTLNIPSYVTLPNIAAGIVTIRYQVAETDGNGNIINTFATYGNIPWETDILVV